MELFGLSATTFVRQKEICRCLGISKYDLKNTVQDGLIHLVTLPGYKRGKYLRKEIVRVFVSNYLPGHLRKGLRKKAVESFGLPETVYVRQKDICRRLGLTKDDLKKGAQAGFIRLIKLPLRKRGVYFRHEIIQWVNAACDKVEAQEIIENNVKHTNKRKTKRRLIKKY